MEKTANKNAVVMKEASDRKNATASAKKRSSSRKIKNLEEEVELILSQEEDGDDVFVDIKEEAEEKVLSGSDTKQIPITPRRRTAKVEAEECQTPRRKSMRKSVKPAQDYDDIVAKKTMRSLKKGEKQSSIEEVETRGDGSDEKSEPPEPKWTPAKVGRGSQKRKKRKSKKTLAKQDEPSVDLEEEMLIAIENDEDENKENVSPQDLLKQRKLSKDNEKMNTSHELINSAERKRRGLMNNVLQELVVAHQAKSVENVKVHVDHIKIAKSTVGAQEPLEIYRQANTLEIEGTNTDSTKIEDTATESVNEEIEHQANTSEKEQDTDKCNEVKVVMDLIDFAPITVQESKITPVVAEHSQTLNHSVDSEDKRNSTFNASDCIIISPAVTPETTPASTVEPVSNIPTQKEDPDCLMQSLLISDDEDENSNGQKVEAESENSESSMPSVAKKPKITLTNDDVADVTLGTTILQTPKQRPKPYRFPTPYKSREAKNLSFEFNKTSSDLDDDEQENVEPRTKRTITTPATVVSKAKLTKLEPKDIILRSIRKKRSLSCTERPLNKSTHRVKFHSPANQTTFIADIDLLITQSATKRKVGTPVMRKQWDHAAPDTTNVTKRRKRSLSVDESIAQMRLKAQALTPNKSRGGTPQKTSQRTKIPNFAAIHQRNFNKMENLSEHLQRKAERAKILTTSTSKIQPRTTSAQKVGPSIRHQNIETVVGAGAAVSSALNKVAKPKALKKINLNDISIKPLIAPETVCNENPPQTVDLPDPKLLLPNPKLLLQANLAVVKPMQSGKVQPKVMVTSAKKVKPIAAESQQRRIVAPSRPPFNLSTHVTAPCNTSSIMVNPVKATTKPVSKQVDKVATRRQRHMDMFKNRKGGSAQKENASEIIRGVRSNRRFDLQMQHRKNFEHHTE